MPSSAFSQVQHLGGCGCASYNLTMDALIKALAPVLEVLFFAGMAGSVLVIVISAVEDVRTIMEKD